MGFGDVVSDLTPDSVEDAVEGFVEGAGDVVETVGNWGADRLEDAGFDSAADWVRDKSGSLANRMGAEVDELDLGQTEDKTKLIHGSPSKVRSTIKHLRDFQSAFETVASGMKGLESSELKGKAADRFREKQEVEPGKWRKGADACEKAAGALERFVGTVEWAQGQAQQAIDKWKRGEEKSTAWAKDCDAYNKAATAYNAKPADERDPSSLPSRPSGTDPGEALMKEAQEILTEARRQRNTTAESALEAVKAAKELAPPKPEYGEQAMDALYEYGSIQSHIAGGVVKGLAGINSFARQINPVDPYNLTHPAEYVTNLNSTAAGLVQVANDPMGAGKQMLSDFMKDPAEGFGRLLPDLALTAATGGAGAGVKAARLADNAGDLAAAGRRGLTHDGPDAHHPDRTPDDAETDPVDLATGRMYLPQTDVVLAGLLPLVFTRRVDSGYTWGRFFGPRWSSTVDERLEIDPVGVVHVTADGKLQAYPHPAPGLPVWPETGAERRLLERTADGDYLLTEPDTGLVRHFTAPHQPALGEPGQHGEPGQPGEPGGGAASRESGADGTAWLAELSDRNGHTLTYDRAEDGSGTPLALVHSGGYHLTIATEGGRVTALALAGAGPGGADQPLISYAYDAAGNLTESAKVEGSRAVFEYDEERRIIAWTDSNGRRYDYVYDDDNRVVAEGGEAGHHQLTISYGRPDPDTGERWTVLTTAAGHSTRHLIDDRCRTIAVTDALGRTTRFTHDKHGRLLTTTDAVGRTTTFGYDEEGRRTVLVRADGTEQRIRYDDSGLPVEYTDADGARSRREYDERGNCTASTDPCGQTTRYTYDDRGRIVSVTSPLGAVVAVRTNAAGLPVRVTGPRGEVTHYLRDAFGRPAAVTDPTGATRRLEWTVTGRLVRHTHPDGTTESWTYDGQGNCTSHTNRSGHTSRYEYTHFDLLKARTDPDGARYEFEHDASARLTKVTNAQGLAWSYTYDAVGRVVSETDFDGRTVRYELDGAGQLTAFTTPLGEEIRYERDQMGRVIRKDAAGEVSSYAYDAAGRLVHATGPEPGSELVYQYDRAGRVKTELVNGRAMTYAYDEQGRRVRRTTPSGAVTTYTHDASGRLTGLSAHGREVSFTRDELGREVERRIGDMLGLTSEWDLSGRLTGQELTAGDRTLNSRAYTYRPDGYLTAVDDTLRGPRAFDLDATGRVTGVTGTTRSTGTAGASARGWRESYTYDAAGNQTSASWPDRHAAPDARGERAYTGTTLARAGANRYRYDGAGRLVQRTRTRLSKKPATWHYTYCAENRLTQVTTPDGTVWRYTYDPLGRRTSKQRLAADGETVVERTDFAWDGPLLCEETSSRPGEHAHPVTLTWDHDG
ncbi:RHS repeat protein, partial [Streptomyces daliensis]|nr:RHS repeat protein [Streptomyces daliensis]